MQSVSIDDCQDFIRLAFFHFIGTDAVNHLVHDVAQIERVEHAHAEVDGELQAGFSRRRLHTIILLEEQYPEAVEARVLQRQAIFRLVHAEAARSAGAGGKEDVIVDDLLLGEAARRLQRLQVLHQIADGEVGRIALAVVAVLFAQLKGRDVRHRHNLATISAAFEDGLDHAFMLPGQAAEKDGNLAALLGAERPLDRTLEMTDRAAIQAHHAGQPGTLLRQLALNLFFGLRTRQFVNREIDASDWHRKFLFLEWN